MNMTLAASAATSGGDAGWRALNKFTLRFADRSREASFRDARRPAELRYARAVLVLVLALTLAIVPLDLRLFDPARWRLLLLGHGLEITAIVSLLALSFAPYFRKRHMALMSALAVFFAAIYAVWDVFFAAPDIYVAGGALVIVAIYVLLPLDFVHGARTGLGCSALYLGIIGLGHPMRSLPFLTLLVFMAMANAVGGVSLHHVERLRRLDFANLREIDAQRDRYRQLLVRILPQSIADRLQGGETTIADRFETSTVLFADVVGFTPASAHHTPEEVLAFLDRVFAAFDKLVDRHGAEKIKTIGDAYMVASGVPTARADHAARVADLALDMLASVRSIEPLEGATLDVRIGISSGPVVAGIIGNRRFSYDLWGDTVNVAARMEVYSEPGRIQVSEEAHRCLADGYALKPRGEVDIKGLGPVLTWYLLGPKAKS
jgi:adenylate cyclase